MADVMATISAELLSATPRSGANILLRGSNGDILFLWALIGLHLSQEVGVPLESFVAAVMESISAAARDIGKLSVDLTTTTTTQEKEGTL